jgi:riboflavin synthase
MFTGIVTSLGSVRAIDPIGDGRDMRLVIGVDSRHPDWTSIAAIPLGASISCSGCCLTAVELGPDWFAVTASNETLSRTTLGAWRVGTTVNLERPLRVCDELGGHIVAGHVDGLGEVVSRTPDHGSTRWLFRAPDELARFIAPKGSVAVDGVSLTVNEVQGSLFGVNIIPHTAEVTTFSRLNPGDRVNLEIDTVARYVARLQEYRA